MSVNARLTKLRESMDSYNPTVKRFAKRIANEIDKAEEQAETAAIVLQDALERGDASLGVYAQVQTAKAEDALENAEPRLNTVTTIDTAQADKRLRIVIRKVNRARTGKMGGVRVFNAIKLAHDKAKALDAKALADNPALADKDPESWTVHPKTIAQWVMTDLDG